MVDAFCQVLLPILFSAVASSSTCVTLGYPSPVSGDLSFESNPLTRPVSPLTKSHSYVHNLGQSNPLVDRSQRQRGLRLRHFAQIAVRVR